MRPSQVTRKKDSRAHTKAKIKKPATRAYDNSARLRKSEENQQLILKTLVQLLVEKKGDEVTFEEIAARAGISERTVYRFYRNKEELHRALNVYMMVFLKEGIENIEAMSVTDFTKYTYELFDRYEDLFTAYVSTAFGQQARALFRQNLNQALISKIHAEKPSTKNPEAMKRIAVIVTLINAKIWFDTRTDFGFKGKDLAESMEWAMRTLLDAIDK